MRKFQKNWLQEPQQCLPFRLPLPQAEQSCNLLTDSLPSQVLPAKKEE